ncbi:MAG TPA: DUF3105 domain-containing protein [Actinomycetota bacterium]
MTDRAGGDGSRRPTKAERKDQARIEREQIQRQMAARKRNRNIGIAVIALAVVAVLVVVLVVKPGSDPTSPGTADSPADLLAQAPDAKGDAGCDDVQTIGFYDGVNDPESPQYTDQAHIGAPGSAFPEMPPLTSYPSQPPVSGPHANIPPGPLPAGFYDDPPDLARVLHSLEHGASVVWYSPTATDQQLQPLRDFYDRDDPAVGQDRVIVAPYDYEGDGGQLPSGVMMSLGAWHRQQNCSQISLPVAFDFTSQYSAPPFEGREYAGEAPEAGAAL